MLAFIHSNDHKINHLMQHLCSLCLIVFLFVAVVIAFVPLSPKLPSPGLDASWALALNHAVSHGFTFGKDIIFTLGPYASLYTQAYHPDTDLMILISSIYFSLCYWCALLVLMSRRPRGWMIAFGVALTALVYARDSLFLSYPLLAGLACYQWMTRPHEPTTPNALNLTLIAILVSPFGLLPLIKGSFLLLALSTWVVCLLFFIHCAPHRITFIVLVSPMVTCILLWLHANQSISHLADFIKSSLSLAFSFSETMSNNGSPYEIIGYLIAASCILYVIMRAPSLCISSKLFIWSLYGLFLFVSFKAGFTRHIDHVLVASTSLLIGALLLPCILPLRHIKLVLCMALATALIIDEHQRHISIYTNINSTFQTAWFGLTHRWLEPTRLQDNFNALLNYINVQAKWPILEGTTDVYSYQQAFLIASKNTWSPRPIFQSYSVFTPQQQELNKQHLLSRKRPDNILFRITPIDNRFPALEDAPSWPILLRDYQPIRHVDDFLVLHRKNYTHFWPSTNNKSHVQTHWIGESIELPNRNHLLMAYINIQPTLWGRVVAFFYKPEILEIVLTLTNGNVIQRRFIPSMAKTGFLISPMIESTDDFATLYQHPNQTLINQVERFTIVSPNNHGQWKTNYQVNFMPLTTTS